MRRLRSCLGLVALASSKEAVAPLAEELRWLGGALGPARDWDVFMTEPFPPLARRFKAAAGLAGFRARAPRVRRAHAAAARDAVASPRYTALLLALGEAFARDDLPGFPRQAAPAGGEGGVPAPEYPGLAAPVETFAAFVLGKRDRPVRRRGRDAPTATPEERHRVRIAAKKLRDAAEFFATLYRMKELRALVHGLLQMREGRARTAIAPPALIFMGPDRAHRRPTASTVVAA